MRLFHNGMAITADGSPDPSVDASDPALLQGGGMLSPAQVAQLINLGGVTVNVLQALLTALATIATQIDTAAATDDDLAVVAAACNCVGAVRAELALRDATATRSRTDAAAMVASIQSAAAAGATVAARLPRISHLAARQPGRTRPQLVTTSAPLVASAGGHAIDVDQAAEVVAEGVRQQYQGRRTWAGDRKTLLSLRSEADESRQLGQDPTGNAAKIDAVTSPAALVASGGICGPVGVSFDVQAIATAGRPLQGAMAGYQAVRGGIRYTTPATLAQVTSTGPASIWTEATDAAPGGATKPHATFACRAGARSDGRCDNQHRSVRQLPGPLLPRADGRVHDHGQRRARQIGRVQCPGAAERRESTQVSAGAYEVGAARELLSILDRAVSQMRYRHRMAPGTPLRFVEPVWLKDMLRSDLAKNLPGDSGGQTERLAMADAEIEKFFSVALHQRDRRAGQPRSGPPPPGLGGPGRRPTPALARNRRHVALPRGLVAVPRWRDARLGNGQGQRAQLHQRFSDVLGDLREVHLRGP